jgi:hypothetical protein
MLVPAWLRMVRLFTRYVVPTLIAAALFVELSGLSFALSRDPDTYNYLLAILFSLLTLAMIGLCGWIVFLWDIDRLFFRLERRIDAEVGVESADTDQSVSVLSRAREMVNNKVQEVRARATAVTEKAYWDDINAGGVLAFPQPNVAAAVNQIDASRSDLLAPLANYVSTALPLGAAPAGIVARMIFRYVAPDVKVRLYRRLVLRFLFQLAAVFVLTAFAFT